MACIDSCAKMALSFYISEDGYYQIRTEETKCVNCGLCTKVCPVLNKPIAEYSEKKYAYAVWDKNDDVRKRAASGGAFSAIAEVVLKKGGVVYGASVDAFRVKHIRIDSLDDLHKLQGSKYQQSEVKGTYKQVKRDLREGMVVLFSGMSCQIAGLISFLGKIERANLFTIDTICGGTSTMLPMLQMEQSGQYRRIVSFRDKTDGWKPRGFRYALKMQTHDGYIENLANNNKVIKAFNSPLLKRASCTDCQFNGLDRISDCTICDFWGIEQYKEQQPQGISGLIVNNTKILTLIENSSLECNEVSMKSILDFNPSYYINNNSYILQSKARRNLLRCLRNGDDNAFQILSNKPNSILGKLMAKFRMRKDKRYYLSILQKNQ